MLGVLLNPADEPLLFGQLDQFLVILEFLGGRLGDEDVMPEVERLCGDGEVCTVWGEDDHCRALGQGLERRFVWDVLAT